MQWMFMLLGGGLGWLLDESFSDALIGAISGLAIGLAIRSDALHRQVVDQHRELEKAKKTLATLGQRLALLESTGGPAAEPASQPPASAPLAEAGTGMSAAPELADLPEFILEEVQPVEPAPAAPELVWELPAAASPAASVEASQPVPESVWQPQPQAPARESVEKKKNK